MSKKEKIINALLNLIEALEEEGIISSFDLIDVMDVTVEKLAVIKSSKKLNLKEVANDLEAYGKVFIKCDSRQRAHYIQKRLETLTGRKISKIKATLDNTPGYLFEFAE